MKRTVVYILIFTLLPLISIKAKAQDFTSNLPIIVITTYSEQSICDSIRQDGHMKIIFHIDGQPNSLSDTACRHFLNYDGRISIKTRGHTSQYPPKKPYAITTLSFDSTNNNVSLLGMPEENDWVLNNMAYEPSYVRDFISYGLSEKIGQYAPRCRYCEVFINNDYKGLYLLVEKPKADKNRIDIDANAGNTCGYIFKADKFDSNDKIIFTDLSYHSGENDTVFYINVYPKSEEITQTQIEYIQNLYNNFIIKANMQNEAIDVGFPSIIDIPSFIDFMIIGEYSSNADVYQLSTYFHKDRQGKLRAGPVWDFNLTYGNDLTPTPYYNRSKYNVWQFSNRNNEGAKFWTDLFNNPTYRCYFSRRWHELSNEGQALYYDNVYAMIDEAELKIHDAIARDCSRWGNFDHHATNIDSIKSWITKRTEWINNNIGSCDNCIDREVPNLVISKINYYPKPYGAIHSDQLEFIEISNNSSDNVNMTGIYFSGLGIGYCFPINSRIGPYQSIIICSDSTTFISHYEQIPFGQYARHLSNISQHITLSDVWGNLIDEVTYSCESPWPIEANCRGSFLELADLDADNNLAENWRASQILAIREKQVEKISIFPNPATDYINIYIPQQALGKSEITIINSLGQNVITSQSHTEQASISIKDLPSGVYVIKVENNNGCLYEKFIKKG